MSDTSPMMKHRCLSSSMKKSYKSPPTSRAGTRLAASENRPAATSGGQGLGQEPHLDFGGGAELTFEAFAAGRGLHKLTDP